MRMQNFRYILTVLVLVSTIARVNAGLFNDVFQQIKDIEGDGVVQDADSDLDGEGSDPNEPEPISDLYDGLVAAYQFDNSQHIGEDNSGNEQHATLFGDVRFSEDTVRHGSGSACFGATKSTAYPLPVGEIPGNFLDAHGFSFEGDFSIVFWVYKTETDTHGYMTPVSNHGLGSADGSNFYVSIDDPGGHYNEGFVSTYFFQLKGSIGQVPKNHVDIGRVYSYPKLMPAHKWHHVVVKRKDFRLSMYINNVEVLTSTEINDYLAGIFNPSSIKLGNAWTNDIQEYPALYMDDVIIYNRALSNEEMLELSDNGFTPNTTPVDDAGTDQDADSDLDGDGIPDDDDPDPDVFTTAGTLNGNFQVANGSANYTVPIEVPPGMAGMQPTLALSYSSGGDNGLLGMGWGLSGLSSITRCGSTMAQDGFVDGVDFDDNDKFCLDGERLVAINGAYEASGTEYRTEKESFSKIISYGQAGSGPSYFELWTKSGQVKTYGETADSRIEAQGKADVSIWALNRVTDASNNTIDFKYYEDNPNGYYRIDHIDYTGNDAGGLEPFASVRFVYASRPDVITGYIAGSKVSVLERLSNIQTIADERLVRDYKIGYETGPTNRSRVKSLAECDGGSPGICKQATHFAWTDTPANLSFTSSSGTLPITSAWENTVTGDFNGDSLTDFLIKTDELNSAAWHVYLSREDGNFDFKGNLAPAESHWHSPTTGDFNGDGLTDFLINTTVRTGVAGGGIGWDIFLANGDGTFTHGSTSIPYPEWHSATTGDYNGDGLSDFIINSTDGGWYLYISNGDGSFTTYGQITIAESHWHSPTTGDFNGDGLTDFLMNTSARTGVAGGGIGWDIFLANGDGTFTHGSTSIPYPEWHSATTVDYNGDGLSDFIINTTDGGWYLYISNGDGSFTTYGQIISDSTWHSPITIDFNSDGMTDFMINTSSDEGNTGWQVYLNKGDAGFVAQGSLTPGSGWHGMTMGDFDGDGFSDLMYYNPQTGENQWYANNATAPDLITTITDGYSDQVTIDYKPMTDPSVYTKYDDHLSNPPNVRDVIFPMQVVAGYSKSDGVGGMYDYIYHYEGAKVHTQGYGFLGFRKVSMTDPQTGTTNSQTLHQDFPLTGQAEGDITTIDGVTITESSNQWSWAPTHNDNVYRLRMTSSETHAYKLDGSFVKHVTTTKSYDDYNNVIQVITDTHDGYKKTTDSEYLVADESNWILGRLLRASVTHKTPTETGVPRVSAFEYNAQGLVTKEIIEPGDPQFEKVTTYTYDVFGNKASITVSGPGITPRETTSTYVAGTTGTLNPQITTTNALGHSETKTYDARFGVVIALTGPNGRTTYWDYDSFGRNILETHADGTWTATDYQLCLPGQDCTDPDQVAFNQVTEVWFTAPQGIITTDSSGSRSAVYFDSKGREVRSTQGAFDGRTIYKESHYDAMGRIASACQPYYGGDPVYIADLEYDVLGRITKQVNPDGSFARTEYNGLTTTVIKSPDGEIEQLTTSIKNSQDQLITVIDDSGFENNYTYDPYGNLKTVTDAAGNVTTLTYNLRGQKIAMSDPDMGNWSYVYNTLGELTEQTDAKGQTVTMTYDLLARMASRTEPEGVSQWTYDTAVDGIGQLHSASGPNGYSRTQSYDSFGRPSSTIIIYNGESYTTSLSYDAQGRVVETTYPGLTDNFSVQNVYNEHGYLSEVYNGNSGALYWQLNATNAEGQAECQTFGNGLQTQQIYNPANNRLQEIITGNNVNCANPTTHIQSLLYEFDQLGNLMRREDINQNLLETFSYDNLNRLTSTHLPSTGITETYEYDSVGNITYKSDVDDYLYGQNGAGPHAVTTAGGITYTYDANGNQISGNGRTLTYTSFNKPLTISKGNAYNTYDYDVDHQRIQKISVKDGVTTTTFYLGKAMEKVDTGTGNTEYRYYIPVGSATIQVMDSSNDALDATLYLHKDHLGSVDTITDENGQLVERNSYDAWGKRRLNNWKPPTETESIISLSTRGFTGHEMEDGIGLIDMNARLYDPILGRFLQPDSVTQAPNDTQGLNRYTYVRNNPLSYTDPSGHFWEKLFKPIVKVVKKVVKGIEKVVKGVSGGAKKFFLKNAWARSAASIALAYFAGPEAVSVFQGYLTEISGGSFGDIVKSAALSYTQIDAFSWVGDLALPGPAAVMAHGMVSGTFSALGGGKFGDGFASAAFGKMVTINSPTRTPGEFSFTNLVIASISGGIAAELGGGKFANGAQTAAMGYLFNEAKISNGDGPPKVKYKSRVVDGVVYQVAYWDVGCDAKCAMNNATFIQDDPGNKAWIKAVAIDKATDVANAASIVVLKAPLSVFGKVAGGAGDAVSVGKAIFAQDITTLIPMLTGKTTSAVVKNYGASAAAAARTGVLSGAILDETISR